MSINKVVLFLVVNLILLVGLYLIPIENNSVLEEICLYKRIVGKECWNCGMTRAFLCVLHGNFSLAFQYNPKVIVVFPFTIGVYGYSWYQYLRKNQFKGQKLKAIK